MMVYLAAATVAIGQAADNQPKAKTPAAGSGEPLSFAAAVAADAEKPAERPGQDLTQPHDPPTALILVDQPVHHFGDVWVGDKVSHTFTVRNVGQADLQFTKVHPKCGCTKGGEHPLKLAPGESGGFPFEVDSQRYNGPFSTTVEISTNDPSHPKTILTLMGNVKHYVTVTPKSAVFGNVSSDSPVTRKLTLTNMTDKPINPSIKSVPGSKVFKGELTEIEAGKKYELTVTSSPPYPTKYNRFQMQIDTGLENVPPIKVYCTAILPKRLDLTPEQIYISTTNTVNPRTVRFTNNGENPVKILEATSADERLQVAVQEKEAGRNYEIRVTIPTGYQPPANGTEIVLKTDDKETSELKIPVRSTIVSRNRQTPTARKPQPKPGEALVGKPAPSITATTYDDKEIRIGAGSEKVQLLAFYASWCGFCKRALPQVEKLHKEYKDKGVDVIAVNLDRPTGRAARTPEQSLAAYKQLDLTMPMTMDPDRKLGLPYKVGPVPTFYIVGKSGEIEAFHTGARVAADQTLKKELDVLLEGKTRKDFPGAAKAPTAQPSTGS